MAAWTVNVPDENPEASIAFASLDAVWALEGESITSSALCLVIRVVLDGKGYYVKRYRRGGQGLAEFIGKSKACSEWDNLARFTNWGLSAAPLVAYGEDPLWRVPRRGVVITAEIEGSDDLASLAENQPGLFVDPLWLKPVLEQVARATAVMHKHHFAHNDWKWRNILVRDSESKPGMGPEVHLIDCPSGTFWWGPLFEYRRIKDLACLDKIGHKVLSRSQRLRFYCAYRGITRLTDSDKKIVAKVVHFFEGRD